MDDHRHGTGYWVIGAVALTLVKQRTHNLPAPLPRPSAAAMAAMIDRDGITRAAATLRIDARTLRRWATEAGVYTARPYRRRPRWRRWLDRLRRR